MSSNIEYSIKNTTENSLVVRASVSSLNLDHFTDKDIVLLVSEWKIKNVDVLFKSSTQDNKNGVRKRYESEKTTLLGLIK